MSTLINTSSAAKPLGSTEMRKLPENLEQSKLNTMADNAKVERLKSITPVAAEVDDALNVVNKAAIFEQRSLSFMMDETSGRSIIKVIDRSTEQLIRQIPSEELLKVAQDIKRLQDEMGQSIGFLVDRQV